jgi:undecaprenyl-diphosphatase
MKGRSLKREMVAVVLGALFLLAAIYVLLPIDLAWSARLRGISNPALAALLTGVSFFGDAAIESALIALATLFLAWQRRWLELWFVLGSTISASAVGGIIRILIHRDRPTLAPALGPLWSLVGRYSFPSGHTLFYTSFFGAIAYVLWARFSRRARWVGIVACLAMIVLVGPSRVYLGAHWPSDVAGGYLVGGLCVSCLILLYQWRRGW